MLDKLAMRAISPRAMQGRRNTARQDAGDPPPEPKSGWGMSQKNCSPFSIPTFSKFQCNPRRLEWFTTVNLTVEKGEFVAKQ
jgi:hypothetical protein